MANQSKAFDRSMAATLKKFRQERRVSNYLLI